MNTKTTLCFLCASGAVLAATSSARAATTYYVDCSSSVTGNSGKSETTPWRSTAEVQNAALVAGDTVKFKKGTTCTGGLTIKKAGVTGSPITFTNYGTATALPKIVNTSTYGSYKSSIVVNSSYVVIDGFQLSDSAYGGVAVYKDSGLTDPATNNLIQNNEINNVGAGVMLFTANNVVKNNYVHDLKMIVNDATANNDYGAICFDVESTGNELSYNRCLNAKAASTDFGVDGGGFELYGTVDGTKIHHNYVENAVGFFETGGSSTNHSAQNVSVYTNVSVNNNGHFGGVHTGGTFQTTIANFKVENNTIIDHLAPAGTTLIWFYGSGTVPTNAYYFRNNIVSTLNSLTVVGSTNVVQSNNLIAQGSNYLSPLFVNVSTKDFHLQSTSPAINAGMNLGYTIDFDGVTVPAGGAPDIGAYEYFSPELISNPGFESGDTSWSNWGNSVVVTSNAHSGSKAVQVGMPAGGRGQQITYTTGATYTFSFWGKVSVSGESCSAGVNFLDANGTKISNIGANVNTTAYTQKTLTITPPAGTAKLEVFIWKSSNAGGYGYIDDLSLKKN